jgi:hypothetical protein
MYLVLEYVMYLLIVAVLAGILFGASVLAIVTKEKAPSIAEASLKAIHVATGRIEDTAPGSHLAGQSAPDTHEV